MLKNILLTVLIFSSIISFGQERCPDNWPYQNPISTGVPFLMIGAEARGGGYGDAGVATTPDVFSMQWNPAKYAFAEKNMGFGLAYTPWLKNLVNGINLEYLSFYHKIGNLSAIGASLRYFTMGEIQFTDEMGNPTVTAKPNEFAIDITYARKLHQNLSLAVAGRFIYSNLTQGYSAGGGGQSQAAIAGAADVALYWQKDVNWFANMPAQFAWGVNISNIGSKVSYSDLGLDKQFIPTNIKFGPRLTIELDGFNKMSFFFDVNKLLVPTTPVYDSTYTNIKCGFDPNVSVIKGMVQSWYDAPAGISEEISEFNTSFGTEYWYNDLFALRAGMFMESKYKGARKYATLGVGLRYNVFGLDFSYLIPFGKSSAQDALANTLRFNLVFDFGKVANNKDIKQELK
jgi:hypothetical protein